MVFVRAGSTGGERHHTAAKSSSGPSLAAADVSVFWARALRTVSPGQIDRGGGGGTGMGEERGREAERQQAETEKRGETEKEIQTERQRWREIDTHREREGGGCLQKLTVHQCQ